MARLIDFGFPSINAAFDAMPWRTRMKLICLRFDEWVRGNGSAKCVTCKRVTSELDVVCAICLEEANG